MPSAMKRPAAAPAKAPPAKAAKAGGKAAASPKKVAPPPPPTKCEIVVKGIRECGDLPAEVRDMLAAAFPDCLVPTRHTIQEAMIGMVEEFFHAHESAAQGLVEAAEAEAAAAEKKKEAQEQAVNGAKAATEAAEQVSAAKATELTKAMEVLLAAKDASSACLAAVATHAEELQGHTAQMASLKELEAKFTALKDGSVTGEVGTEINSLVSEGKKLGFDSALLASVPSAVSKPPEARGQFDQMVIEQVATAISEKQTSVQAVLAEGDSEAARLQASVGQAEQAQADALAEQEARVSALEAAKEDAKKAADRLSEESKAVTDIAASVILAFAEIQAKKKLLEDFQAGPYAAFKELRDGPKAAAQVPEEKVEEPGEKAEELATQATEEDTEGAAPEPAATETAVAASA